MSARPLLEFDRSSEDAYSTMCTVLVFIQGSHSQRANVTSAMITRRNRVMHDGRSANEADLRLNILLSSFRGGLGFWQSLLGSSFYRSGCRLRKSRSQICGVQGVSASCSAATSSSTSIILRSRFSVCSRTVCPSSSATSLSSSALIPWSWS